LATNTYGLDRALFLLAEVVHGRANGANFQQMDFMDKLKLIYQHLCQQRSVVVVLDFFIRQKAGVPEFIVLRSVVTQ